MKLKALNTILNRNWAGEVLSKVHVAQEKKSHNRKSDWDNYREALDKKQD
ncbi:hypothetical protein BARBAKC583_0976 [Bartonella bacilliformis KC583]|uniref:Uncharacterized protein n=1 Tax=Bartonella bacilliformis (strain ATCC 35685 / KC583 / Herrer 020/F12,63) TaxID=360095 RepID=A1UTF2_BARBK|nr:hypothetical protein BARBAKC583_0976 [Bartonella bacilliformis KC583]